MQKVVASIGRGGFGGYHFFCCGNDTLLLSRGAVFGVVRGLAFCNFYVWMGRVVPKL